uniref:Uncharacterized protein n=1 Tax=viral metagenome TaxID=1070528 RepID=A0A6M3Y196_9ZZZZ
MGNIGYRQILIFQLRDYYPPTLLEQKNLGELLQLREKLLERIIDEQNRKDERNDDIYRL